MLIFHSYVAVYQRVMEDIRYKGWTYQPLMGIWRGYNGDICFSTVNEKEHKTKNHQQNVAMNGVDVRYVGMQWIFFWILNVNHGKSIGILHRIATPCCSVATPFRQSCQGWDPGRTDVLEDGADVLQAILKNPRNKGWMTNRECLFHTKSTSTNILVNIKQVYPYTVYIYIILKVPYLYNIYI